MSGLVTSRLFLRLWCAWIEDGHGNKTQTRWGWGREKVVKLARQDAYGRERSYQPLSSSSSPSSDP